MWAALWARLQGWLLMAGAVLLVLVGAYAAGGRAARKTTELEQQRRNAVARRRTDEQIAEIDRLDDDDIYCRAVERMQRNKK